MMVPSHTVPNPTQAISTPTDCAPQYHLSIQPTAEDRHPTDDATQAQMRNLKTSPSRLQMT
jgi:hypothetical protein